ncbi:Complex I intermediate-associated protein 30, mitochondrial [Frankliniella fusca]|uniref:Complex I intermediate-associated protein 30, mitochondrial n=1 Tax=Frankliniella fusca TaxID=407009 RepID=A0AAE1LBM0_9NEOP|nr:Complex I intermediate-associated protein 30, mitochondrial [Frankliniella fusca]KAK3920481.1 Complex I intermediate-associated protein 30, mitochondrial [Frankliniella fusca]
MKAAFSNFNLRKQLLEKTLYFSNQNLQRKRNLDIAANFFHTTRSHCKKYNVNRSGGTFFETSKRGGYEVEDDLSFWEHAKRGARMLPNETKKLVSEVQYYFSADIPREGCPQVNLLDKYFEFGSPESLENWSVACDQDYDGGFSTAEVSLMPSGTGLFSGNICTRVPKTGEIENSGYANLRFIPPMKSFAREKYYFFAGYSHMVVRVRGDGRTYMINLHPHALVDLEWFNLFSYTLHTRGGPYWQETRIPFSKFFLHHKGRVQDDQFPADTTEVKNISITLLDQNDGPFSLEIDYLGCIRDPSHTEVFAYESYRVPKWTPRN